MTHRHQARHFEARLKKAGIEYTRGGWDLEGSSNYFRINIEAWMGDAWAADYHLKSWQAGYSDQAAMMIDGDFEVRFANHGQVAGGGFSQARQDRMGESTISINPGSALTYKDVCWWLGA